MNIYIYTRCNSHVGPGRPSESSEIVRAALASTNAASEETCKNARALNAAASSARSFVSLFVRRSDGPVCSQRKKLIKRPWQIVLPNRLDAGSASLHGTTQQ